MIIHNQRLAEIIRPHYSAQQISDIIALLRKKGTLDFSPLPNGLFPAASFGKNQDKSYTGYSYVWVRDNIHIAHAHYVVGDISVATKTLRALMQYFVKYRERFVDIITGKADPDDPMNRPHIRFNGGTLEEIDEKWAHAQNDALGYFLWMFSKLVSEGKLSPSQDEMDTLALFPLYLHAIRFWEDEDSGHWEEARKISASSIGTVVAGLRELQKLIPGQHRVRMGGHIVTPDIVASLMSRGSEALASILPAECVQRDAAKLRLYDGALLFLIYPLQVVGGAMAENILDNTIAYLQGDVGVRRYPGDSYWAPDYKKKLKPEQRTVDFSDTISSRDQLLPAVGEEAQWCIFDPILSCIYGCQFKANSALPRLAKQAEYLNRSLGQITSEEDRHAPPFRCPELYYLENGRYIANDHVPLLWTQANLMLSLQLMLESCHLAAQRQAALSRHG